MNEIDLFWQGFVDYLSEQLSPEMMKNWVDPVTPSRLQVDQRAISIHVPNGLTKQFWETTLASYILSYSLRTYGAEYIPTFVVAPKPQIPDTNPTHPMDHSPLNQSTLPAQNKKSYQVRTTRLNPNYTFDNFVIGDDNVLAASAAYTVVEKPGTAYNPLLIYGGVGLGKTHLMQAIGHRIAQDNPDAQIIYVTSEEFVNDFVESLRHETQREFRKKYRETDVLLVDDIQFLANKESTQTEFFNVFNTLYEQDKQIVLTSDRLPSQINDLEERLTSRFEWGLSTDITPPDLETRIAILRQKASNDHLDISPDVLTYIANNIDTNIRELEGALTRVLAYATTHAEEITINLAAEALKSLTGGEQSQTLTCARIIKTVAKHFGITENDIKGRRRTKEIVVPRQIGMYLARELTDFSFPKIGEEFGNKNHTTVIHAYEKINENIKNDQELAKEVEDLIRELK